MGKNRDEEAGRPLETKIDMKRGAFLQMYEVLGAIQGAFDNQLHRYCAVTMRYEMKARADALLEMRNSPHKIVPTAYNEARQAILVELSSKDANGKPIVIGHEFALTVEARAELVRRSNILRQDEKYKESVEAYDKLINETNDFLDEEETFDLPTKRLKLSWFNKNMGQQQMEILFPLIQFDAAAVKALAAT